MSLAEQITRRNQEATAPQVDELGIVPPNPETPEYWAARAIGFDWRRLEQMHAPRIYGLHRRGDEVWQGHTQIRETAENAYKLSRARRRLRQWEVVAFWQALKDHIPYLNTRYLEITEGLYWDIERARIVTVVVEE